jgi:hypothetical protein
MAGYLGNIPSAVPLTSADIADGIITSAKIVDGTIVNADINASAAIDSTKLSGVTSDYVLLATSTATGTATSLSLDGYFSSTYRNYELIWSDFYASNDGDMIFRLRRSNADITTSNYRCANESNAVDSSSARLEDTNLQWNYNYGLLSSSNVDNGGAFTMNGKMTIYNPLGTSNYKTIEHTTSHMNGALGRFHTVYGAVTLTDAPINIDRPEDVRPAPCTFKSPYT